MSSVIGAVYLVVGILFAIWTGGAFDDRSQWLAVFPVCVLFWPVFVVGILGSWVYFELVAVVRRWQR